MKRVMRRGLLFIVFLLALQLLLGATTALAEPGYHMVRPGETLFSIGRLYGVNPYTIASMNGLYNPNYIQIGQVLYVPTYGGWSYPSWTPHYPSQYWWPGWGYYPPWGGCYYPPSVGAAKFRVGTLYVDMVDPKSPFEVDGEPVIPIYWTAAMNGLLGSAASVASRLNDSINQAFDQSPYLQVIGPAQ